MFLNASSSKALFILSILVGIKARLSDCNSRHELAGVSEAGEPRNHGDVFRVSHCQITGT